MKTLIATLALISMFVMVLNDKTLAQNKKGKNDKTVKEKTECEKNVEILNATIQRNDAEKLELVKLNEHLKMANDELLKKVSNADQLFATNIKIETFKVEKGEKAAIVSKAKDVNKIAIWFEFIENDNVLPEVKKVNVILTDPKGKVLNIQDKKFIIKKNSIDSQCSLESNVEYKKVMPKNNLNLKFDKKLLPGKYKIEIYTDGFFSCKSEFELEK